MHPSAKALGHGSEEQSGADRSLRRDPKQENEHRSHQGAATNASEADDDADQEPSNRVEQILCQRWKSRSITAAKAGMDSSTTDRDRSKPRFGASSSVVTGLHSSGIIAGRSNFRATRIDTRGRMLVN